MAVEVTVLVDGFGVTFSVDVFLAVITATCVSQISTCFTPITYR